MTVVRGREKKCLEHEKRLSIEWGGRVSERASERESETAEARQRISRESRAACGGGFIDRLKSNSFDLFHFVG